MFSLGLGRSKDLVLRSGPKINTKDAGWWGWRQRGGPKSLFELPNDEIITFKTRFGGTYDGRIVVETAVREDLTEE